MRRWLVALLLVVPALPASAADNPAAPINAIYKRVTASYDAMHGTTDNGYFIWKDDKTRRRHFSARTARLWQDTSVRTPKGDQGPMSVDPVTNSQDPSVRAFETAIEKQDASTATLLVRIADKPGPIESPAPRHLIRYDMARERGRWLIDDIRGGDGASAWSVRKTHLDYLAWCAEPAKVGTCRR